MSAERYMDPLESLSGDAKRLARELEVAYASIRERMEGLPICNPNLDIAVIGPCRSESGWIAVAVTPWCMNLVLTTDSPSRMPEGSQREVEFASGRYRFTVVLLNGVDPVEICSLFSPMNGFTSHESAVDVAREALKALLDPAMNVDAEPEAPRKTITRRGLLRGRGSMSTG